MLKKNYNIDIAQLLLEYETDNKIGFEFDEFYDLETVKHFFQIHLVKDIWK